MRKLVQVVALVMFVFYTSYGQNKTDLQKNRTKIEAKEVVTSQYGSKSMVRSIKQDRKGNIWLASVEGIIRYNPKQADGKSFTNITSKVISARFFSVLEDRKGNFWFATIGSGVYFYDGKSFQNYTTKDGLINDRVATIYEDKSGAIWFGTEAGASRYDGKSFQSFRMTESTGPIVMDSLHISIYQKPIPESHWMHNDVNSIVEDKTGKLWFGTRGYTRVFDGKTFTTITNKDGKPFANVRSITRDKKGAIWLGGYDGLWRYDGSTFTNFTRKFVGNVYEDRAGNIWTSSESTHDRSWALSRYDQKSLSSQQPTITEIGTKPMFFGITEANDGSIWFEGLDGVYRYDGKTITDFKNKEEQK